ncbi:hypothetical protein [Paraburkholderia flagellata]|uniref:hypothetical protein n=1 Tax=Paraburkholderia flagellata TaxID=2883241 RepID=UPI001F47117F|nr:hypothetical protein [Paraburkholderia flagellata]
MGRRKSRKKAGPPETIDLELAARLLGRNSNVVRDMLERHMPVCTGPDGEVLISLDEVLQLRGEFWTALSELALNFIQAVEEETLAMALADAGIEYP